MLVFPFLHSFVAAIEKTQANLCYRLGKKLGANPVVTLILFFAGLVLLLPGLGQVAVDPDVINVFLPDGAQSIKLVGYVKETFPW